MKHSSVLYVARMMMAGVLFVIGALPASADESAWSNFRGPSAMGVSTADDVPIEWDESNIAWKVALPGGGASSPIVWGEYVFVTCYSGYGTDSGGASSDLARHLMAFDRDSGERL